MARETRHDPHDHLAKRPPEEQRGDLERSGNHARRSGDSRRRSREIAATAYCEVRRSRFSQYPGSRLVCAIATNSIVSDRTS